MTVDRSDDTSRNGRLNVLAIAAIGLVLVAPTAVAGGFGGDAGPSRTIEVTPDEGSRVMSYTVRVPLADPAPGAASDTSSCSGTATDSCTGSTWTLHCCELAFETTVFVGTVGQTTNRLTGLNGPSGGNVWEFHCDWFAVVGFCAFHEHGGGLFQGDDAQHTGSAIYDACVPGLCEWTVQVENQ